MSSGGGSGGPSQDSLDKLNKFPPSNDMTAGGSRPASSGVDTTAGGKRPASAPSGVDTTTDGKRPTSALPDGLVDGVVTDAVKLADSPVPPLASEFVVPKKPRRALGLAVGLSNLAAGGSVMVESVKSVWGEGGARK